MVSEPLAPITITRPVGMGLWHARLSCPAAGTVETTREQRHLDPSNGDMIPLAQRCPCLQAAIGYTRSPAHITYTYVSAELARLQSLPPDYTTLGHLLTCLHPAPSNSPTYHELYTTVELLRAHWATQSDSLDKIADLAASMSYRHLMPAPLFEQLEALNTQVADTLSTYAPAVSPPTAIRTWYQALIEYREIHLAKSNLVASAATDTTTASALLVVSDLLENTLTSLWPSAARRDRLVVVNPPVFAQDDHLGPSQAELVGNYQVGQLGVDPVLLLPDYAYVANFTVQPQQPYSAQPAYDFGHTPPLLTSTTNRSQLSRDRAALLSSLEAAWVIWHEANGPQHTPASQSNQPVHPTAAYTAARAALGESSPR